ncbi:MAG: FGGY family carbohydrate kinase [bacterium]
MIVGIDIGTQSLKAVVTDERLRTRGESSRPYAISYPHPGWAEQNPADWEQALGQAVADALARAGAIPRDVRAIAVVGQLDGCIAVGGSGEALAPCIIWMDRRAEREIAGVSPEAVRRITGNCLDAGHMAAKIRWYLNNKPGAAAVRFHQPVSYIVSRLTGEHVMDPGLASTTMLYSIERREYDISLLNEFGIDSKLLPIVADAAGIAGRLSAAGAAICGIPEGTPVAVGTGDDFSTPLGAGITAPGSISCVLGTAEVVGALDERPKVDIGGLVETHCYVNGKYFIENPGWLSGGALSWFVKTFNLRNVSELESLAAQAPAGADGLIFIPALSGAMAPEWAASARGCYYGLTPAHGTAHMARATMEGCAFAMRDVIERLRELGTETKSVTLLGGGARSVTWARIRADIGDIPVEIPDRIDTSQLGAAALAAVACGIQPNIEACAGLLRGETETIMPEPENRELYENAYSSYRRLFESLKPMFNKQD